MKPIYKIIILSLPLAVGACKSLAPASEREAMSITPEMLVSENLVPVVSGAPELSGKDVLRLSPEMIEFVDRHVDMEAGDYSRTRQLLQAIINDGVFNMVYDDSTRTAADTFQARRGNCLSFTNMFIAMARHAELNAEYQEVEIPPDWSMEGRSFIFNRHINVYMDLGSRVRRVVDFDIDNFKSNYETRRISDRQARAHYFNNIGVERMLAGDSSGALYYLRQAIDENQKFEPAWVNIGALYRREGRPVYAEAAYLHALKLDPGNLVALSNLASLFEEQGEQELVAIYEKRVKYHRMRNPYYSYKLAREAYDSGEYEEAIDHMKFAVRYKKNVDSFYYLLGLSYFRIGDQKSGERWISRAAESVEKDGLKQAYNRKLERLLSSN